MPFSPQVIALLEDVLSEGFKFHSGLDLFLQRSGIPASRLTTAREQAEKRSKASPRGFQRAPKRFVAQEVLQALSTGSDMDDRLLAGLVTAACKTTLKDASETAIVAQKALIELRQTERNEAEERREIARAEARSKERERELLAAQNAARREALRDHFLQLSQQENPQARGYMLEKFLNEFLEFEGLSPRASFKIQGEQIDGSFQWSGRTHLVEAKWIKEPVGGAGFSALIYKIDGKTADTRGLFISINGYSADAIQSLNSKGALRFVCIDGAHIVRALEPRGSFPELLERIWRHASETGEAYVPVNRLAMIG